MSFRTTIVIAVILLLLGGYAYFIEYKGGEKKKEQKEKQKTLLEVKKEEVAELRLEGLDQPVKIVPASADQWRIASPLQVRADESTVSRILTQLEKLQYEEIIDQQPKDLAQYGLDKPNLTIDVVMKKSNAGKTVKIGGKNPVGNLYYLQLKGDPRVYAVGSQVGDLVTTTIFDLRDKKLTDFENEKVQSLAFRTAQSDLLFQKESGVWKMKKPVASPASDNEISSLLSSLEFLKATEFIDQPAADTEEYGLNEPEMTVELQLEKGLKQRILFGSKTGEQIYCQVEGTPGIATVSDSFSVYKDKKLDDWREKKVVIFNRFDAQEVRLKASGKEYVLKKDGEEKWRMDAPQKGELESEKVQDLLEKLENAEIARYSENAELTGTPVAEVHLTLKDWQDKATKKSLMFGPLEQDMQPLKNADYNTVVFTNGALLKEIETKLAEFKPKPPAKK